MATPLSHEIENEPGTKFVTEVDWIPSFWNFLLGLDRNDLIAELVQNDLDQEATCTVISFEQDRLVCEGNGKPVDSEGWQRLRVIQGAGNRVPAKRGRIGIKNHGLKTAFTIGDEIRLVSAGRSITQTLYARGRDNAPHPGASREPEDDPQAPIKGCRIIIKYRYRDIEPREGEAALFGAVSKREIDELFKSACDSMPTQFAGIVAPETAPRYQIVLRHWHFGEARFAFSCSRPRKTAKGIEIFRRRCDVSGDANHLPPSLRETAARRLLPLKGQLKKRVADFYRHRNRFFVEVSWPVDGRGKPRTGTGRFRYPIGYPEGSHEALTGHGAFFNAPIVSDTERHGPARNDATNKELREACEKLLVDALAHHVIPQSGHNGLNPLVPILESNNEDEAVRPLLAALARRGSMPTLKWRDAADLVLKSKRWKASAGARLAAIQRRSGEPRKYRFVVPATTWEEKGKPKVINPSLSVICPRSERQLDPRVHTDIVRLLADGKTDGFSEDFITFDQNDALSRAKRDGNQYFAACENPEREFAQPLIARFYLDVIEESVKCGECGAETQNALKEALLLPDAQGKASQFEALHTSVSLPSGVPGLSLPPILHPDLVYHPLFRRSKWRRPKYTMMKFLESRALQEADEQTRKLFWKWLHEKKRNIKPRERPKLIEIAIWPDIDGNLYKLLDLCNPRSERVATVLGDSIRRPHEHVRRSRLITSGKKHRASIRSVPSLHEISDWLERRIVPFVIGDMANADTITALNRFEADLTILLKNSDVARVLGANEITLPALAQDGSIQERAELVMPSKDIAQHVLRERFLLKNNHHSATLNKLSQALSEPSADMLLATLSEDHENFGALQARLRQFIALTEPSDGYRTRLARMPIIPVDGHPRAPCDLAFSSSKGDYWGNWKTRIPGTGLSQDDQGRYRAVGVMSASPKPETSQAFFRWLSGQSSSVLEQHVTCVLRYILLRPNDPIRWAETFTDIPFIPAEDRSGLRLVSLHTAFHRPVYLPDTARETADAVIANDTNVALVIDRVKGVGKPISGALRELGVRSLREAFGDPERVVGSANVQQAFENDLARIAALRSRKFRSTFYKCLGDLRVESELIRNDWHDRLSRIKEIRLADDVQAQYRFRRKPYRIAVSAGFDRLSGTFWIKHGHEAGMSGLFEAIASQLVFKTTARPIDLLALERALTLEIHDPSFGRPASTAPPSEDKSVTLEDSALGREGEGQDDDADLGEAVFGHAPFEPDPTRNVPDPRPISSASSPASPRRKRRGTYGNGLRRGSSGNKPAPELERKHTETLKLEHYASHCQMCLCERPPQELAPVGSYIEWEEVRRSVVEAHHVDLKSAGGARHAGNLILLCKLHHGNYGRRLTRVAVTDALRGKKKDEVIHFGKGNGDPSGVKGQVIAIVIPDTGEVIKVFFTDEHAAYWLSPETSVTGVPS